MKAPGIYAPTPREAIPRRPTAGAPSPPAEPHTYHPNQGEWEPTSPRHRELVEVDPLGLHEIRKKMGVAIRSLAHRKKAEAASSTGSKGYGGTPSNELFGVCAKGWIDSADPSWRTNQVLRPLMADWIGVLRMDEIWYVKYQSHLTRLLGRLLLSCRLAYHRQFGWNQAKQERMRMSLGKEGSARI